MARAKQIVWTGLNSRKIVKFLGYPVVVNGKDLYVDNEHGERIVLNPGDTLVKQGELVSAIKK